MLPHVCMLAGMAVRPALLLDVRAIGCALVGSATQMLRITTARPPTQPPTLYLLLTLQVQFAFLAGLALVILLIPVNRWLANRIQAASVKMMGAKDRRAHCVVWLLDWPGECACFA